MYARNGMEEGHSMTLEEQFEKETGWKKAGEITPTNRISMKGMSFYSNYYKAYNKYVEDRLEKTESLLKRWREAPMTIKKSWLMKETTDYFEDHE